MNFKSLVFGLGLVLSAASAHAATTNFSIIFNTPASTSVSCTALGPFTIPVVAGTTVANCVVAPSSWAGTLAISGTGASAFVVNGTAPNFTVNVGSSDYNTAGTLNLTATSAP